MGRALEIVSQTAVVVGATGGIGRALIARLNADPRFSHVVALSRHRPESWPEDDARSWRPVDILDEASLTKAAAHVGAFEQVTRIIVATGLLHRPDLAPEKSLAAIDASNMAEVLAANAIGPALVAKHFLPLTPRDRLSVFAALSARVGSIADNGLGGWFGYRASKAALNQLIRTAAIEHHRTRPFGVCVVLHPGTVETALSAPFTTRTGAARLFSPSTAAGHLLKVMDDLQPDANGGFFAWDGAVVPW
jgi:NAD(P)-dependent dehydrogenase (short-subunit alcohol dehydrogenase family)